MPNRGGARPPRSAARRPEGASPRVGPVEIQGRAFAGSLQAPRRNDTRRETFGDLDAAMARAEAWTREGFTVWVFDRVAGSGRPGASELRVIATLMPEEASRKSSTSAPRSR